MGRAGGDDGDGRGGACRTMLCCLFGICVVGGGYYAFGTGRNHAWGLASAPDWERARCVVTSSARTGARRARALAGGYAAVGALSLNAQAQGASCRGVVHARTLLPRCIEGMGTPSAAPAARPQTGKGCACIGAGWSLPNAGSGPGSSSGDPCTTACCDPDGRHGGKLWCPVEDAQCEGADDGPCSNATAAMPAPPKPKSINGCVCSKDWYLGTCEAPGCNSSAPGGSAATPCDQYCCNPIGDPAGDWCFVEDPACEPGWKEGVTDVNVACAAREKADVVWSADCVDIGDFKPDDEIDCWVDDGCEKFDPEDPQTVPIMVYVAGGLCAAGVLGCCALAIYSLCRSGGDGDGSDQYRSGGAGDEWEQRNNYTNFDEKHNWAQHSGREPKPVPAGDGMEMARKEPEPAPEYPYDPAEEFPDIAS